MTIKTPYQTPYLAEIDYCFNIIFNIIFSGYYELQFCKWMDEYACRRMKKKQSLWIHRYEIQNRT